MSSEGNQGTEVESEKATGGNPLGIIFFLVGFFTFCFAGSSVCGYIVSPTTDVAKAINHWGSAIALLLISSSLVRFSIWLNSSDKL
jgi:hypothetical protein